MNNKHIFFIGDLRSPFIQQDLDLLREGNIVEVFDLGKHAFSFRQLLTYQVLALKQSPKIQSSDAVWIWFADYPALPFIILANIFNKSVVMNVGGWEVYSAPDINYGNQLNLIRGAVTRWILRNSDVVVVPSEAYKKITSVFCPTKNIRVVPNCVDPDICDIVPLKKNGAVTAICTSSTMDLKGIPTFEKCALSIPNMGVIKNVPHEDLIEVFKRSKVYCQLSYTESFGMSLLEAMACGCVPVVTDRDALPEVVSTTGLIVPYGDVKETACAINKAMTMDGNPARERALSVYSKVARKEAINKVLENA